MNLIFSGETNRNRASHRRISIMKTFCVITVFLSIVLNGVGDPLLTLNNSGPLTIKLMTTQQALDNATVSSKTNAAGEIVTVSKSTVSNSVFQTVDFFKLLEN